MQHTSVVLRSGQELDPAQLEPYRASHSVLAQVFAATTDRTRLQQILDRLSDVLPHATVVGLSSDGTIENGTLHEYGDTVQISVTRFDKATLAARYIADVEDGNAAGEVVARTLCNEKTRVLLAFSEARSVNGEEFLEGIYAEAQHLLVSGGVASSPTFSDTFVIYGREILTRGVVAVALNDGGLRGDGLHAFRDHSFGWVTIGREMTITDADHAHVRAIDGRAPLEVFSHYLGSRITAQLPGLGSAFPLMVRRGDCWIARGIIAVEGETFIVSGNVRPGDKVHIGYGNPSTIARRNELSQSVLRQTDSPEVIFAYYCEGRRLFMPSHMVDYEIGSLGRLGEVAGVFTLGEFYTEKQYSLMNFSSTLLILSERTQVSSGRRQSRHQPPPPTKDFELISEGLFHLIDARTKELEHQAHHDELTGLPNKAFFTDMLELAIQGHSIARELIPAVFFIDVDDFKHINDTRGHPLGDQLLAKIAERLREIVPSSDTLARYGGDEFLLLTQGCRSTAQIARLASRLLDALATPFEVEGRSFRLSASIGISVYPTDGHDHHDLIRHADAAMYEVKSNGKNAFAFYHPRFTKRVVERLSMEDDLRRALRDEDFLLHYQPQVDLRTRQVVGAEALIRWNHPEKGLLMPADYIGLAEETGLVVPIGEKVLELAMSQMRQWLDRGIELEKVSVNVSGKQFSSDTLVPKVVNLLERYSLPPCALDLEITESVVMSDTELGLGRVEDLARLGVSISIDDFGTGYSSLSYLNRFRINTLKIDKSFIDKLPNDESNSAIAEAIMVLAKALGLNIVAEGVETQEQEHFLTRRSCDIGQGFFYSHPLPVEEFEEFFHRWSLRPGPGLDSPLH